MDRVLASLRSWALSAKTKKARDKNVRDFDKESSFQSLPIEILEEIFQHLSQKHILQCRGVCSFLRLRVDQLYTKNSQLILNDRIYSRRPSQPLLFDVHKLSVQKLTISAISASFFRQNFLYLNELNFYDCISTKNFQKLLVNTPNLQILRMNSIAMGGSKTLHPGSFKGQLSHLENTLELPDETLLIPLRISEIHLTFDYVPGFHKGFSCQILIANLLELHNWNTPGLHTISYTVEPSSLMEQFYFSLDTFISSIPYVSYKSLINLSINSPKLQKLNSSRSSSPFTSKLKCRSPKDLHDIQLHHLSLQISNSSRGYLSSTFTKFLHAQRNLKTIDIRINDPSFEELEFYLKKQNNGLHCLQ